VLPGLVMGSCFVSVADDTVMRRTIGVVLLVTCLLSLRNRITETGPPAMTGAFGGAAGFATMTANSAGPVTTLYLLTAGLPKMSFLGTTAWFYLVVNAVKLPFSASLDLITADSLRTDALLMPALAAGAMIGVAMIARIQQEHFAWR
jgi:uncharacterized membrane protein YfcA